jgi:hypothetical protein
MPTDYIPTSLLQLHPQAALPKGFLTVTQDMPGLLLCCEGAAPQQPKLFLGLSNQPDGFDVFSRHEDGDGCVGVMEHNLIVDLMSACPANGGEETIGCAFLSGNGPGIIGAWRRLGGNMRLAFLWTGEQVGPNPPSGAVAFKSWKLVAKVADRELVLFERG